MSVPRDPAGRRFLQLLSEFPDRNLPVHPGWCDPRYCRFTDIDIQHRSTPTLLTTCDHEWWFTLARADEWAHSRRYGDTELLIDVHNTGLRVPDVQHLLRAHEIEPYANRLLIEHRRM